jgi:hypothetical protein
VERAPPRDPEPTGVREAWPMTTTSSERSSSCVDGRTEKPGSIRNHASCGSKRPSHGVPGPTTLAETGSDLHRACLPRLCCAFRLSQPLDASFRPQPLRPCFVPVTPLGFGFQRFSLSGSGPRLSTGSVPLAVLGDRNPRPPGRRIIGLRLRGFAHPASPYRAGPVLSELRRPILS